MHRFYLDPIAIQDNQVNFPDSAAKQIEHVLRLNLIQSHVLVLDGSGWEYLVQLRGHDSGKLKGEVIEKILGKSEPEVMLTIGFSMTRREKVEWILQKGTEIGVTCFQPYISERSLLQDPDLKNSKQNRWESIIREAAEQSHRSRLPILLRPQHFTEIINTEGSESISKLIAWEQEPDDHRLNPEQLHSEMGKKPQEVFVMIGPEGGFSNKEIEAATNRGFQPFSLGPRILRMETACVAACVLVLHLLETAP